MQPALIAFFFLIVIFAIILLTLDRKLLQDQRPEVAVDLSDQRAQAYLISMLRTPVDVNGRSLPLSEIIILNENGGPDRKYGQLLAVKDMAPPGAYFLVTVRYANGATVTMQNSGTPEEYPGRMGHGTALLPGTGGNVNIEMALITQDTCDYEGWECKATPVQVKLNGKEVSG